MKRTQVFMNKPAHLGLSILEISKITIYEIWHDYMKPKSRDTWIQILCSLHKNRENCKEIAKARFDSSNYELERTLYMRN